MPPALADVGTARLLAHGVERLAAHEGAHVLEGLAAGRSDPNPRRPAARFDVFLDVFSHEIARSFTVSTTQIIARRGRMPTSAPPATPRSPGRACARLPDS